MCAYRYGNRYLITLFKEQESGTGSGYGSYAGDYSSIDIILANSIVMKPTREAITVRAKTGKIEPYHSEVLAGRKGGAVTISGELSHLHAIMLQGLFSKSASPYQVQSGNTPFSYEIHQYFTDDAKGNVATGCVLESMNITGESNGTVTFEAVFRVKSIETEVDLSSGDYAAYGMVATPHVKPFLVGDIHSINLFDAAYSSFNSFSLSLANRFINENALYQNSFTKRRELIEGFSGEATFDTNYDSASGWFEDELLSSDVTYGNVDFTLTDGTHQWVVETNGKITAVNPADPERQIFAFSATVQLMADNTNPSVKIIVT